MNKQSIHIRNLCMIGLFTAVISIMAQIVIPMPFGVPMTMQTFAVMLAGMVLGAKNGMLSALTYILIGSTGVPVFANFTGGWQSIAGPTGGFLLSFPLMAYIAGLGIKHGKKGAVLSLTLATCLNLLCGTLYFCLVTDATLLVGCTTCILPFLLPSILKGILVYIFGRNIKRRLQAFF